MVIKEYRKLLEKCTPREYQYDGWMGNCHQMLVQTLHLDGLTISVDVKELDNKTDDVIKKLIKDRMIGVLRDAITRISE